MPSYSSFLLSKGKNHIQTFVPKICSQFTFVPTLYLLLIGCFFRWASKCSKVVLFLITKFKWNRRKFMIMKSSTTQAKYMQMTRTPITVTFCKIKNSFYLVSPRRRKRKIFTLVREKALNILMIQTMLKARIKTMTTTVQERSKINCFRLKKPMQLPSQGQ